MALSLFRQCGAFFPLIGRCGAFSPDDILEVYSCLSFLKENPVFLEQLLEVDCYTPTSTPLMVPHNSQASSLPSSRLSSQCAQPREDLSSISFAARELPPDTPPATPSLSSLCSYVDMEEEFSEHIAAGCPPRPDTPPVFVPFSMRLIRRSPSAGPSLG